MESSQCISVRLEESSDLRVSPHTEADSFSEGKWPSEQCWTSMFTGGTESGIFGSEVSIHDPSTKVVSSPSVIRRTSQRISSRAKPSTFSKSPSSSGKAKRQEQPNRLALERISLPLSLLKSSKPPTEAEALANILFAYNLRSPLNPSDGESSNIIYLQYHRCVWNICGTILKVIYHQSAIKLSQINKLLKILSPFLPLESLGANGWECGRRLPTFSIC